MKTNVPKSFTAKTHEGGVADPHLKPSVQLERAVASCMLFENTFYKSGSAIAQRIADLCQEVTAEEISALAIKARTDLKLRHAPLWLCVQLLKKQAGAIAGATIASVVSRPDEAGELISLYRKDKRIPLAAQLKKGLAKTFQKFSAYQVAKWDRDAAIKLKDVLFMVHAKPKDVGVDGSAFGVAGPIDKPKYKRGSVLRHESGQGGTWKQLIAGTLESPDTWEVALSAGQDKKQTWERLLTEKKLGYMALLMNLRNMEEAKVTHGLVAQALLKGAKGSKALPFRFVSAVKHAPGYARELSDAMELAVEGELAGSTAIVIDVSGSMNAPLSAKGTLQRWEAAAALAVLARGLCTGQARVFTYNNQCREVPGHKGLGLVEAVGKQVGGWTETQKALQYVERQCPTFDRLILLTDEQAHDGIQKAWTKHAYLINVASYAPGLEADRNGYHRINGFSERLIDWIRYDEAQGQL